MAWRTAGTVGPLILIRARRSPRSDPAAASARQPKNHRQEKDARTIALRFCERLGGQFRRPTHHFGMKAHVGVDANSELTHTTGVTSGNVPDAKVMDRLCVRNLLTRPVLVSGLSAPLARGCSYWDENAKARDRICPACRHALADWL